MVRKIPVIQTEKFGESFSVQKAEYSLSPANRPLRLINRKTSVDGEYDR